MEIKYGRAQLHSEAIYGTWDSPRIVSDKPVSITSGYLEGRYDFLTRLFAAARFDALGYSEILNPTTDQDEPWGDPLTRIEAGLGYRLTRESMVKLVYQRSDYASRSPQDDPHVLALQLHMVF